MSIVKPFANEVVYIEKLDSNGCKIVMFYEAHGSFIETLKAAGFPASAKGYEAVKLTTPLFAHFKASGLVSHGFTANRTMYRSAHAPSVVAQAV